MLHFDEVLFAISLALGSCLVLGSALGVGELLDEVGSDSDGAPEGHESGNHGLSALGLGRVPLGIVVLLLTLQFGAAGCVASPLLRAWAGDWVGGWLSLALAFAFAWVGTQLGSRLIARVLPTSESYASRKSELVGREASVLVVSRSGEAVLRALDAGGAELRLRAVSTGAPLRSGDRVLVVAYDAVEDRCDVEKMSTR